MIESDGNAVRGAFRKDSAASGFSQLIIHQLKRLQNRQYRWLSWRLCLLSDRRS